MKAGCAVSPMFQEKHNQSNAGDVPWCVHKDMEVPRKRGTEVSPVSRSKSLSVITYSAGNIDHDSDIIKILLTCGLVNKVRVSLLWSDAKNWEAWFLLIFHPLLVCHWYTDMFHRQRFRIFQLIQIYVMYITSLFVCGMLVRCLFCAISNSLVRVSAFAFYVSTFHLFYVYHLLLHFLCVIFICHYCKSSIIS